MIKKLKIINIKESGITLVALVVTIIVLLILAGISIRMALGNNGMIKKASETSNETIVAKEKEQIELAYVSAAVKKIGNNVDQYDLQEEINNSVGNNKTEVNGSGTIKVKFIDSENKYKVFRDGRVIKFENHEPTKVYAKFYVDGTLVLSSKSDIEYKDDEGNNVEVEEDYGEIHSDYTVDSVNKVYVGNYPGWFISPYRLSDGTHMYRDRIKKIIIKDFISPTMMSSWFYDCNQVEYIEGLENIDTSNCTDLTSLFDSCTKLKSVDVSHFDTSNVTSMKAMFSACSNITKIDVSNFDTSNVTMMNWMLAKCPKVDYVDLSCFDTSKVTDMSSMFQNSRYKSLDLTSFDTSNVNKMTSMFNDCIVDTLDLRSFETSNVTNMNTMFYNSRNLSNIYVDANKWIIKGNTAVTNMFGNCGTSDVTYIN